ncbi:VKORC1 [Lepeophtheirus salmonis]|uniref:vitamin-K-epoxide reductase (warfarin-sensitive) n=1 Tax=Lepeophtheirus salmonis TaxID=72036 RepID=A0A7R8D816_LEPSM|nr:VKORC1 [Lepeophtheirus salmonis]CAF3004877.1 VKORC1 [Lepeophtheirus salmonis]
MLVEFGPSSKRKESETIEGIIWSLVLCVAGLTTSLLTYYVEMKKLENPESEALCDINEDFNCSAVITSPYAVGFGVVEPLLGKDHFLNIPNPLYGIAFYLVIILFSLIQTSPLLAKCQFFLVLLINCGTPILGYIMLYVIQKYSTVKSVLFKPMLVLTMIKVPNGRMSLDYLLILRKTFKKRNQHSPRVFEKFRTAS